MGFFSPNYRDVILQLKLARDQIVYAIGSLGDQLEDKDQVLAAICTLRKEVGQLGLQLAEINRRLLWIERGFSRPGTLGLTVTAEENDMLRFEIQLPPLPSQPNDIDHGMLTVVITPEGGEPTTIGPRPVPAEATTVEDPEFLGPDNAAVDLSFTYVDDAGNESGASTLSVTLTDTIAPPTPGTLGLTEVSEE